jgi:hypothetical protein
MTASTGVGRGYVSGCLECGAGVHASAHIRGAKRYTHDYSGASAARAISERKKHPELCPSCTSGEHAGRKTEIGCVETVAKPPEDFVCRCVFCRANPSHGRTTKARSSSEGVVRLRA